jgi:two-component sensor histidine kinase
MQQHKNHLTFDIQALTTQQVQYSFILEGYDEKWSAPISNNEITYSNISPGEYVFKAKAINSEGIASAETLAFSFTVRPPWWNTWWFRIAALLVVLISLFTFIKARERVLKEQNIKLEKTVKERTAEIARQKDVVEKTLAEKETLLREKEILLKEIHHRVKNNLQTISSILMLQSAGLKDEQAKKAIAESQSRVRSIALVHQKLYQTDGLEKVELSAFITDLTVQVQSLYSSYTNRVSIQCSVPEIHLLIDTAIPLGLIMNELLTNSFKYAFNELQNGFIMITVTDVTESATGNIKTQMKKLKLIYKDSGPGFSPDMATGNVSSLGLRLIHLLSQQIGAALQYSNASGSEYIFTFELHI